MKNEAVVVIIVAKYKRGRDYYLADFDKFAASNAVSAENELEKSRGKKTTAKLETNKFFSTNKTSK